MDNKKDNNISAILEFSTQIIKLQLRILLPNLLQNNWFQLGNIFTKQKEPKITGKQKDLFLKEQMNTISELRDGLKTLVGGQSLQQQINYTSVVSAYAIKQSWIFRLYRLIRSPLITLLIIGIVALGFYSIRFIPPTVNQAPAFLVFIFNNLIILFAFLLIFLLISIFNNLIIQYRLHKGYFGRNHYETKKLLEFITELSKKDDFYDDDGKPRKTFEELKEEISAESIDLKDWVTA